MKGKDALVTGLIILKAEGRKKPDEAFSRSLTFLDGLVLEGCYKQGYRLASPIYGHY